MTCPPCAVNKCLNDLAVQKLLLCKNSNGCKAFLLYLKVQLYNCLWLTDSTSTSGRAVFLLLQGPGGAVVNRCFTRDGGQAYGRKMTETWIPSNRTPQARLSR